MAASALTVWGASGQPDAMRPENPSATPLRDGASAPGGSMSGVGSRVSSMLLAAVAGAMDEPAGSTADVGAPGSGGAFTVFTPSADTRIVYVSNSGGNDANDGLSAVTPKRTIAAGVALLRDRRPDWLLLRTGDTFTNEPLAPNWMLSGRSASEKMLISTYGSGDRPVVRMTDRSAFRRQGGGASPPCLENAAPAAMPSFDLALDLSSVCRTRARPARCVSAAAASGPARDGSCARSWATVLPPPLGSITPGQTFRPRSGPPAKKARTRSSESQPPRPFSTARLALAIRPPALDSRPDPDQSMQESRSALKISLNSTLNVLCSTPA